MKLVVKTDFFHLLYFSSELGCVLVKLESGSTISLYLELVGKVSAGLMIMKKMDNGNINLPFVSW